MNSYLCFFWHCKKQKSSCQTCEMCGRICAAAIDVGKNTYCMWGGEGVVSLYCWSYSKCLNSRENNICGNMCRDQKFSWHTIAPCYILDSYTYVFIEYCVFVINENAILDMPFGSPLHINACILSWWNNPFSCDFYHHFFYNFINILTFIIMLNQIVCLLTL